MPNQDPNQTITWHPASELPPDDVPVIAELKPARKNAKRKIFAVVEYLRTRKGVHDAEPMWFEPISENEVEVVRWRYIEEPVAAESKKVEIDPDDPRPTQSDEELGLQYRILLKSHRKGCHVNFATGDIWRSDDPGVPKVLTPAEFATLTLNSDRYKKLRGWMSSAEPEGWSEVERLRDISVRAGYENMDAVLDELPECTIGLCAPPSIRYALSPNDDF